MAKIKHQIWLGKRSGACRRGAPPPSGVVAAAAPRASPRPADGPRRTRTRTFRGSVGSVTMNEWNAI